MNISDELKNFRAGVTGCRVIIFADISTKMVLAHSTRSATPQEALDELCTAAAKKASGPIARKVGEVFGEEPFAQPLAELSISSGEQIVFVRSSADTDEALCLVMDHPADTLAVLDEATALLQRISSES